MSSIPQNKDDRINLRLKSNTKLLLERAASFEGKTVSKFILNCALERAEKTIHEHNVLRLSGQDSEAFLNALDKPVQFNSDLLAAFDEHKRRVTSK